MHREFKFFNIENRYSSTRQSPNCILKNKKIKYGEKRFSIWRMEFLHSAMWHVALGSWQWIHHWQYCRPTLQSDTWLWNNSPGGSILQCGMWLLDEMPLNLPKRLPYWNFYFWFRFRPHHHSRHVILHQSAKFYSNRTTIRNKWRQVQ